MPLNLAVNIRRRSKVSYYARSGAAGTRLGCPYLCVVRNLWGGTSINGPEWADDDETPPPMSGKITILGGGAMATACSVLLAEHAGRRVSIWVRDARNAQELSETRENRRLLPGVPIPPQVEISADIEETVEGAEYLVAAIPTRYLRETLTGLAPYLTRDRPVISVIKGIENETFYRPSEIVQDVLGNRAVVALGGPSHAEEIARRKPASVVAASGDVALARAVQRMFTTDRFRVYTNSDIVGVELAAALKNIIAIAAGISDGLEYGDNAKSALMTRGLVEITRFGVACGAEQSTFAGLAGMGDLITTCISRHSRNRHVGELLGQGKKLDEVLAGMESVAEGVTTTQSVHELAQRRGIDMPITAVVHAVLFEGKSAVEATDDLMLRPPKGE